MSGDHLVTMRLPDDLLASLRDAARAQGCSPADVIRQALRGVLTARKPGRGHSAADLRQAANAACGWADLQARLRALGFMLRADGADAGIRLHSWPIDRPLMAAATAGLDVTDLTLRFGGGFPGIVRSDPRAAQPPTRGPGPLAGQAAQGKVLRARSGTPTDHGPADPALTRLAVPQRRIGVPPASRAA
jgi:hypothetical protein